MHTSSAIRSGCELIPGEYTKRETRTIPGTTPPRGKPSLPSYPLSVKYTFLDSCKPVPKSF